MEERERRKRAARGELPKTRLLKVKERVGLGAALGHKDGGEKNRRVGKSRSWRKICRRCDGRADSGVLWRSDMIQRCNICGCNITGGGIL